MSVIPELNNKHVFFVCFKQMSVELDVFVGNTTIMDEEVYQLWLDGYTGRGNAKHM